MLLILLILILTVSLVWAVGVKPLNQQEGKKLNDELLALSEQLLYKVKTDKPTDSIQQALSKYSIEGLRTGLVNDNARKVFWINLYNAWYQIFAIRDKKSKSTIYTDNDIHFADVSLSLDDIEHGILRRYRWKYSLGYLPQFLPSKAIRKLAVTKIDFRIHFALNCGAKSCPPIAFYQYNRIDEQLETATQSFLQNETTVDSARKELHVTKIMQWFKGDFGGEHGIKKIISKYLGTDVSSYKVRFNDYDWREDLGNFTTLTKKVFPHKVN